MSGCGDQKDGTECLRKRSRKFKVEIVERILSNNYKHGQILWHNFALMNGKNIINIFGIIVFGWIFGYWFL
uniref:Uncharacterized protein n=1 Tax=Panagrolaimus sp. PS1159 TaxID=55785 RepID=A0AC35F8G3_9BILA